MFRQNLSGLFFTALALYYSAWIRNSRPLSPNLFECWESVWFSEEAYPQKSQILGSLVRNLQANFALMLMTKKANLTILHKKGNANCAESGDNFNPAGHLKLEDENHFWDEIVLNLSNSNPNGQVKDAPLLSVIHVYHQYQIAIHAYVNDFFWISNKHSQNKDTPSLTQHTRFRWLKRCSCHKPIMVMHEKQQNLTKRAGRSTARAKSQVLSGQWFNCSHSQPLHVFHTCTASNTTLSISPI